MKTFGLFLLLFLVSCIFVFNVFKELTDRELIMTFISLLNAYIYYRLIKEED